MDIKSCRALVVDDDPTMTDVVGEVLEQHGVMVYKANSGTEALGVLNGRAIDVVLTDIRMDGMDGFQLMKRIQRMDPSIKVVVMTGYDSYDTVLQALQAGAFEYLEKPLNNHQTIISSVTRAYEFTQLHRENARLIEQITANNRELSQANQRLIKLNKELEHLAITDSLTMLYNRRYIDEAISLEAQRQIRYHDPLSVIIIDVDAFKQFNDEHGHDGGDQALILVAETLSKCVRTTDVVGRYGGEEFVVLLTNTTPINARKFAERARREIEACEIKLGENIGRITISVGVAGINAKDEPLDGKSLLINADKALYQAKSNGRNCVVHYDDIADQDPLKKSA